MEQVTDKHVQHEFSDIEKAETTEVKVEAKPKRKRRTPAEMAAAREAEVKEPTKVEAPIETQDPYPTDYEKIQDLPLDTYEDYVRYNECVRRRRKRTRKVDLPYKYAPHEVVHMTKVRLTRTKHRGNPININLRCTKNWVKMESPLEGYKDGEEVMIPTCFVDRINEMAEPKYKQIKYPDGSSSTVLDYWDNKYNAQVMLR